MEKYKIFNPNNKKYLHVDNSGECSWTNLKNSSSMTLIGKADLVYAKEQLRKMLDEETVDALEFIKETSREYEIH